MEQHSLSLAIEIQKQLTSLILSSSKLLNPIPILNYFNTANIKQAEITSLSKSLFTSDFSEKNGPLLFELITSLNIFRKQQRLLIVGLSLVFPHNAEIYMLKTCHSGFSGNGITWAISFLSNSTFFLHCLLFQ